MPQAFNNGWILDLTTSGTGIVTEVRGISGLNAEINDGCVIASIGPEGHGQYGDCIDLTFTFSNITNGVCPTLGSACYVGWTGFDCSSSSTSTTTTMGHF